MQALFPRSAAGRSASGRGLPASRVEDAVMASTRGCGVIERFVLESKSEVTNIGSAAGDESRSVEDAAKANFAGCLSVEGPAFA